MGNSCVLCVLVEVSSEIGPRSSLAVALVKGCAIGKSGVFALDGLDLCDDCSTLMQRVAEGHNDQVARLLS